LIRGINIVFTRKNERLGKPFFRVSQGINEFLDYVKGLPNFKATIETTSSSGISISYKIAED
jgi:hypothetical protein